MADAAVALSAIQTAQFALQVVQTLALTAWEYPPDCSISDGGEFDFIIVGGGSAGSVLANRLSANSDVSVLLIEAGGYAPIESDMPALFNLLVNSQYDYNYTTVNDNYTAQNVQGSHLNLVQGKMLGGSSANHHSLYTRGDPHDYDYWAAILNDPAWNSTNVIKYFIRQEKLTDPGLLHSPYAHLHGTEGNIKIARQLSPVNDNYLKAFAEHGSRIVDDTTSLYSSLGHTQPLMAIGDNVRQNTARAYLSPIKHRCNLCVALFTTATKILTENGKAVGVQVTTSNNETYKVYAKKEVIVSAGAFNSPKLLMLSGIGPKSHLEELGIEVVADLPVGDNLQEHICDIVVHRMEKNDTKTPVNPHQFPGPCTIGYVSLNSSQTYPDYQIITLVSEHNSAELLQLCGQMFKYSNDICQTFFEAGKNHTTFFSLVGLTKPESRGKVLLASTDPKDAPVVHAGSLSNESDLVLLTKALVDYNRLVNTTYFKSVDAKLVQPGPCSDLENEEEFWKCYAVAMSNTMWHFVGTCPMGSVLDSNLRVKGVKSLRVVDSSSMPTLISGPNYSAVTMIAERAADLINSA